MAIPSCILIIEDSVSLAMTFKAHLDGFGHTLLMAADGKTAYAMLRDHKVDCILLDLNLPDMEGLDLLEDVRGWPVPPSVVVISSNTSLATAERAVRGGAFDYLLKPFSEGRLVTTVENALANVSLKRELEMFRRTLQNGGFGDFIGHSVPMQALYRTLEAPAPRQVNALPQSKDAIETLAMAEQKYIENAIVVCGGNLQLAARKLGISPSTIYRKKESWQQAG